MINKENDMGKKYLPNVLDFYFYRVKSIIKKDISIKSFVTRSNIHVMRNDNFVMGKHYICNMGNHEINQNIN